MEDGEDTAGKITHLITGIILGVCGDSDDFILYIL